MSLEVRVSGVLTVEIDCPHCGATECYEVEVMQNDFLDTDGGFPVDVSLDSEDIIRHLKNFGWAEVNGELVCQDCVADSEWCGEDIDDEE